MKGVTKGAISHAAAPGGPLHAARVGAKLNTAHPAFQAWLHGEQIGAGYAPPESFGIMADVSRTELTAALRGELAEAISGNCIRVDHPAALRFLRRHPFRRAPDGLVHDVPQGFLVPALVGEEIDMSHPFAQAFSARCGVE
ncbi:MAG TPA: hypothetical protein VHE30_01485 [Polyangiaceae bacterium]|nr:hypothetical protein [Polyangiaceae bacterium]